MLRAPSSPICVFVISIYIWMLCMRCSNSNEWASYAHVVTLRWFSQNTSHRQITPHFFSLLSFDDSLWCDRYLIPTRGIHSNKRTLWCCCWFLLRSYIIHCFGDRNRWDRCADLVASLFILIQLIAFYRCDECFSPISWIYFTRFEWCFQHASLYVRLLEIWISMLLCVFACAWSTVTIWRVHPIFLQCI